MNYQNLLDTIRAGRNGKDRRGPGRATRYFLNADNSVSVKYHNTNIITFFVDGHMVLNSDGWRTATTKSKINEHSTCGRIHQDRGQWYWRTGDKDYLYVDNMEIGPDGRPVNGKERGRGQDNKAEKKLKALKNYSRAYMDALFSGKVQKPGAGDCLYCQMTPVENGKHSNFGGTDHLNMHFREKYYVPSLLLKAIGRFSVSIAAKSVLGNIWSDNKQDLGFMGGIGRKQLQKSLYRYLKECFSMAA